MNQKHIFRALNLIIIGVLLLLIKFDVLHFKWSYFSFIPAVLLVYLGLSLIFNYFQDQKWAFVGKLISFVAVWGLIFLQFSPSRIRTSPWWGDQKINFNIDEDDITFSDDDSLEVVAQNMTLLYTDSTVQHQKLDIKGGVLSINLKDTTQQLIQATLKGKGKNLMYDLKQNKEDSVSVITFKPKELNQGEKKHISGFNEVKLKLNPTILWTIDAKGGVGDFDFDLSKFKIEKFDFKGGASNLELKLGDLLPKTEVEIKSGVSAVEVHIPKSVGCEIVMKDALTSTDFEDFTKVDKGLYRTENFNTATKKIYINFKGGISSYEVKRY